MDNQLAAEMQMDVLFDMFKVCNAKVIDVRHRDGGLTQNETQSLKNCYVKFLRAPEKVMGGLESAGMHGL